MCALNDTVTDTYQSSGNVVTGPTDKRGAGSKLQSPVSKRVDNNAGKGLATNALVQFLSIIHQTMSRQSDGKLCKNLSSILPIPESCLDTGQCSENSSMFALESINRSSAGGLKKPLP